ncbi:CdaR family protein [Lactobacillus sp. ESL0701]|uniref:CdaR family protein n=1 Tax=Lactobacillus sp. ESL0701 TaxID=2983217 RepID=UPI0023F707FD|nr:CdaR family protein [Lactobacillus sp. ESL0701]MDF7672402.1 CdaR family protein [Lactobacillus sp. ESL0701]
MKNFWHKSWFIRLVSLLIAILLVIYINYTQEGFMTQGQSDRTKQTATQTRTVKVPLQVSVDTDNYYVVGYPAKVSVTLEGANALVTSTINTQNFRAYIDLTNKSIGEHDVHVHVSGLSKQLAYTISPKTVHVNIQRRKSTTMPVQIEYNKTAVARGYKLGKVTVTPQQVEVTGSRSEVDQIDQIVAKAVLPNGINHSFERQVNLIAEDRKGQQLNVIIEPATAKVMLPISIAKKEVKLELVPKHENTSKVYSLTAKNDYVTIYGKQSVLSKINKLTVPVDLSGVNASTTKMVTLKLPNDVTRASSSKVSVQIKVANANDSK